MWVMPFLEGNGFWYFSKLPPKGLKGQVETIRIAMVSQPSASFDIGVA